MSMIHSAAGLGYTSDSRWRVVSFLTSCWVVFQEWRSRRGRLAELCDLNDRALMDIGIARGEIEYKILISRGDPRSAGSRR
jgi:uncharacterized protein YjiS (DUF1127 family)